MARKVTLGLREVHYRPKRSYIPYKLTLDLKEVISPVNIPDLREIVSYRLTRGIRKNCVSYKFSRKDELSSLYSGHNMPSSSRMV